MKKNAFNHLVCTLALLSTGCLTACSVPATNKFIPNPPQLSALSTSQNDFMDYRWTGSRQDRIRYARERILKKTPYNGSIQLQVIPETHTQSHLSAKKATTSFLIQSAPQEPTIFQEDFTKNQADVDTVRTFQVDNTASRYTLHVSKQSNSSAQVEININGTDWIKGGDFTGQNQAVQKDSLLLNTINS